MGSLSVLDCDAAAGLAELDRSFLSGTVTDPDGRNSVGDRDSRSALRAGWSSKDYARNQLFIFAFEHIGKARVCMERSHRLALFVLFLFLQPLSPIALRAQVDRTAITGTVTDQQGNRVPQCRVRATESATGFQRETLTTSRGHL